MNSMTARAAHTRRARIAAFALAAALMSTVAGAQQPATSPNTWAGTAGAGLSLTRGNSDTVSYNVAFDVTRTPTPASTANLVGSVLTTLTPRPAVGATMKSISLKVSRR